MIEPQKIDMLDMDMHCSPSQKSIAEGQPAEAFEVTILEVQLAIIN